MPLRPTPISVYHLFFVRHDVLSYNRGYKSPGLPKGHGSLGCDYSKNMCPASRCALHHWYCARRITIMSLLAGDGPKRIDLEQMREKHMLQDRVDLLGSIKHSEVRNVCYRG